MQLKITILCILSFTVLQLHAQQTARDHPVCQRLVSRCEAAAPRVPPTDDSLNTINELCRGRAWRNLTRCQLVKAACRIKMNNVPAARCEESSCEMLAKYSRN